MTDRRFHDEREKALTEIHEAMSLRIRALVTWSRAYMKGKDKLSLPDHMRIQEGFRWPAAVMFAASDLQASKPLKEVFSRVSTRYQAPDPRQVLGLSEDFARSPVARTDGRASAFEDILKVLDIAERDFDLGYRPLSEVSLAFWHRRHPIDLASLELSHRENQRHHMRESLGDLRGMLTALRDGRISPPAPKPPSP